MTLTWNPPTLRVWIERDKVLTKYLGYTVDPLIQVTDSGYYQLSIDPETEQVSAHWDGTDPEHSIRS